MADTVSTMTTLIRDNLDEAAAGYWSDAEIARKIVRRYREIWSRIVSIRDDWFKATAPATVTLVAGTLKYTFSGMGITDFFRVCSIRTTTTGKADIRWEWRSCKDPRFIEMQRSDANITDPAVIYYDIEGTNGIVVSPYPTSALTASMEYYQLPSDPATTFALPDPVLRYIEAGATADCLAKGPVGLLEYWRTECDRAWMILLPILSAPRSGQNNGYALSPFEVP